MQIELGLSLEQIAFLTARRAVDRGACDRWVKSQGVDPDNDTLVENAKRRYRSLPLLSDESLARLSLRALAASRGVHIDAQTRFPASIWYGGASDTFLGVKFLGNLGQFVEHVLVARSKEIAEKRCGWVVTPTSNSDGHRVNASTTAIHALNLDCDGNGTWDRMLDLLRQLRLCFVAYQSGGWSPQTPKWHLLIPLARPFDTSSPERIERWKQFYNSARVVFGALAGLSGEGYDPTVETPCVPIFITERRRAEDPPREVVWQEGASLDFDALVRALPEVPPEEERGGDYRGRAEPMVLDDARLESIVEALCAPMEKILSGRRELYLALPGALLDRGIQPDDVRAIVEEISLRCSGDPSYTDAEIASKHKEHLHCTETTIRRWERAELYLRIGTVNERWPEVARAVDAILPDPLLEAIETKIAEKRVLAIPARAPGSAPPTAHSAPAAPPPLPQEAQHPATFSLDNLRKQLSRLRSKKKRSKDIHEKIRGAILDALLQGEDLTPVIELDDGTKKLVDDQNGEPINRDRALSMAVGMVAFKLPIGVTFDAVRELLRPSIARMVQSGETMDSVMNTAKTVFLRSVGRRIDDDEKRRKVESALGATYLAREYA